MDLIILIWTITTSVYILFRIMLSVFRIGPSHLKDVKSKLPDGAWSFLWGLALVLAITFFVLLLLSRNNSIKDILNMDDAKQTVLSIISVIDLILLGFYVIFAP